MGSSAAGLAATSVAGLAALLVEGLARGLATLEAGLAGGLAGGSSPCGKQFASGALHMKYNFPLAKTFTGPHTPRALFAHTISVSSVCNVTVFFNTTQESTLNRCQRRNIRICAIL